MLATIEQQAAEVNSFANRLDAAYKELESTNARLKEIAFKDDVTGLYSRRFFSMRVEEEVSRYTRFNHPVSLVLLDLDGFNAAKEGYGRAVSENILFDCAQILMKHNAGSNVISRFDADFFAVLLVGSSYRDARLYANRIREAIAVYPFRHGKGMKASVGIASLPGGEAATAEGLFQAADAALFAANRSNEPL